MYRDIPNAAIRKRARRLIGRDWLRAAVVPGIVMLIVKLAETALEAYVGKWAEVVFALWAAPVTMLGMTCYLLDFWYERPARVRTLFSHIRRLPMMLGMEFFIVLLPAAASVVALIVLLGFYALIPLPLSTIFGIIAIIGVLALVIALIWLEMRLSLSVVYLAENPYDGIFDCLGASWEKAKGHAIEIFCHNFMLTLPISIVAVISELFNRFALNMTSPASAATALIVLSLLSILLESVLHGYIMLATVGQAEFILSERVNELEPETIAVLAGNTDKGD